MNLMRHLHLALKNENRGIGFEITRQLAEHGLTVLLTSRDNTVGPEAAKVFQEVALNVFFHQLDIVDPESVKEFADWIQENYNGLDILINNAGVNYNVGSENSVEHAKQVINTNYYGTKRIIEAVIPLMKPSPSGARIVNVSSRLGRLNGKRNIGHPHFIHRDIKSAKILLDHTFEAKVADFGLAKLSQDNYTHVSTRVMGTFGYLAPEYAASDKLIEKFDVFSFGVMLLELITR